MLEQNYQHALEKYKTLVLDLPDAQIEYRPEFIDIEWADKLFSELLQQTQWEQHRISLYGKTHDVPRLSSWVADEGLDYGYSNMTMKALPWCKTLLQIKQKIEQASSDTYNSVLLNYYRDGQDSNGWHSDDEPELGRNPAIASLSLGAPRDFHLRHKSGNFKRESINLEHGSLLLMTGTTQHYWQHHIPKRAKAGPRLNLTFRTIKK